MVWDWVHRVEEDSIKDTSPRSYNLDDGHRCYDPADVYDYDWGWTLQRIDHESVVGWQFYAWYTGRHFWGDSPTEACLRWFEGGAPQGRHNGL